ncbi:MAG: ribosomal protein S18-alanine N-acetyltransferase [Candidatus Heimdallarchaeota archaeon]
MKEQTIIIRQFKREDLDTVVQINRKTLPENYPSDFFLYCFQACPEGFLVAETEQGRIIGYIMLRLETGMSNFGFRLIKKGHIVSIAVLPEYHRRGTGTRLLKSAMSILSSQGINEFHLEVRVSNSAALSMYKKLNFQKIKVLKRYYHDGESAYRMAVKLPKA